MRVTRHPAVLLVIAAALLSACGSAGSPGTATCSTPTAQAGADDFHATVSLTTLPDGLQYGDFRTGCGPVPRRGQVVTVQYTGWLQDGTVFDSSRTSPQAFPFPIGTGQVIQGWDEGVATMRVGGKRRLVIPPSLAYGSKAEGAIPANSTLTFDIELLSIGDGMTP